jgi:hypothetical protein
MSRRGPKSRTAANSHPSRAGFVRGAFEPTSPLNDAARLEFDRLADVLQGKGTFDRVDLSVVTEAARIADTLNRAFAMAPDVPDLASTKLIGLLLSQKRGLWRELGLTTTPSRSVVRAKAGTPEAIDPIALKIKLLPPQKGG